MAVYIHNDKEFGNVKITLRAGMKRIIAKVNNGQLCVSFPIIATRTSILRYFDEQRQSLRQFIAQQTPKQNLYSDGKLIHCFGFDVLITTEENPKTEGDVSLIVVPKSFDFSSAAHTKRISDAVRKMVARRKPILINYAWQVAVELNIKPSSFVASNGFRRLGTCNVATKQIRLSYALLFLPEHLVRYIICHELAHLTHPNHSKEFHDLCNKLVGGKEKEYSHEVNHFEWPVLK